MMKSNQKFSPVMALVVVLASLFIVSGMVFKITRKLVNNREHEVEIKRFVHSSGCTFNLPLTYLSELLGFYKQKIQRINLKKMRVYEKRLMKSPLIKRAALKINSGQLELDYDINFPRAKLFDFQNVLVDEQCIILPQDPFFNLLNLSAIYVGTKQNVHYGRKLKDHRLEKAMQFLSSYQKELQDHGYFIECIDVEKYFDPSLGKRQVVLTLTKNKRKYILRLATKNFSQSLEQFYCLEKKLKKEESVVDLRIKDMAIYS